VTGPPRSGRSKKGKKEGERGWSRAIPFGELQIGSDQQGSTISSSIDFGFGYLVEGPERAGGGQDWNLGMAFDFKESSLVEGRRACSFLSVEVSKDAFVGEE